jgi:circadian clock protein KaiC
VSDQERVSTGNAQADEILGGGFPSNSINIVMGQPGTGKSIFAEQLVFRNASEDRPILYLTTLSEPLAKMVNYLQQFAFFGADKIGKSVLFEDIGPQLVGGGVRALLTCLEQAIDVSSPKMIVIDSFRALHDLSPSPLELRRVLFELTGLLTAFRTTVFLVGEYTDGDAQRLPEFAVADGIVQFMRSPLSTSSCAAARTSKVSTPSASARGDSRSFRASSARRSPRPTPSSKRESRRGSRGSTRSSEGASGAGARPCWPAPPGRARRPPVFSSSSKECGAGRRASTPTSRRTRCSSLALCAVWAPTSRTSSDAGCS